MFTQTQKLIGAALQRGLNAYLALDPESKTRLHALQDKTITLELSPVSVTVQLVFKNNQVQVSLGAHAQADTVIKGTPLRLLHMTLSPRANRKQFFADDVVIEGDLDVGQKVIDLFDHMEIDWEEYVSYWVGDTAAYQIGRVMRQLSTWGEKTRETLGRNVNEYVHEEIDLFPPAEALQDFFQDVDAARMDVDRLEARIQSLRRGVT